MSFPDNPLCPNCQNSMEAGYIVSMSGIHWSPDKKVGRFMVPNMKTDTLYPDNTGAVMQNPRFVASRCPTCELVLLGYSS